jgi:hypothetical protein
MIDFLTYYSATTSEDISFKLAALTCLKKSGDVFAEYNELRDSYSKTIGSSEFKQLVLEARTYAQHYKDRLVYQERAQISATEIQKAQTKYTTANQKFGAKDYDAAENLSLDALKTFSCHCTKDSPKLRNIYALLGYYFFKRQNFVQAKLFLEAAISLTQPDQKGYSKEKYQSMVNSLQTCNEALKASQVPRSDEIVRLSVSI